MEAAAAGAGLVGEHQARRLPLEPADQRVAIGLPRADRADAMRGDPCRGPAWATALAALWTAKPTQRVLDAPLADLRLGSPCAGPSSGGDARGGYRLTDDGHRLILSSPAM